METLSKSASALIIVYFDTWSLIQCWFSLPSRAKSSRMRYFKRWANTNLHFLHNAIMTRESTHCYLCNLLRYTFKFPMDERKPKRGPSNYTRIMIIIISYILHSYFGRRCWSDKNRNEASLSKGNLRKIQVQWFNIFYHYNFQYLRPFYFYLLLLPLFLR